MKKYEIHKEIIAWTYDEIMYGSKEVMQSIIDCGAKKIERCTADKGLQPVTIYFEHGNYFMIYEADIFIYDKDFDEFEKMHIDKFNKYYKPVE